MNERMRALADFLDEQGLEAGKFFDVSMGETSVRVMISETAFDTPPPLVFGDPEKVKLWKQGATSIRRKLKRAFGPFVTAGSPPIVMLKGFTEIDGMTITASWYGAFSCEITGTKEVEKTEDEIKHATKNAEHLLKAAKRSTKTVHTYDCKPVGNSEDK